MITKVRAARYAARSGCCTVIASGRNPDVLVRLADGESLGTLLLPDEDRLAARKQWLVAHLQTAGRLVLDEGAVTALRSQGRSLLPVGVKQVEGRFSRGEVVACVSESGEQVAVGLVNYDSEEAARIAGLSSDRIAAVLGYMDEVSLMHRDNLATL